MIEQKFKEGDRIKVTFEADVSYVFRDKINYITFDNGQELEFPEDQFPDSVVIEVLERPLEVGWWEVYHSDFAETVSSKFVLWWDGKSWKNPYIGESVTYAYAVTPIKYLGQGSKDE